MKQKILHILRTISYRIVFAIAYIFWIPVFLIVAIYIFAIANPIKVLITGHAYSFDWEDIDMFKEEKNGNE